jgi:hypothetical protein
MKTPLKSTKTEYLNFPAGYLHSPKIAALAQECGSIGVINYLSLLLWAANKRKDGVLSNMEPDDIEIVCDWSDDTGTLFETLVRLDLIRQCADGAAYFIVDWERHL